MRWWLTALGIALGLVAVLVWLASCCGPRPAPRPTVGTSLMNAAWDSSTVTVNGVRVELAPMEGVFWDSTGAVKFGWTEGVTWRFEPEPYDSSLVRIRWEFDAPPTPGWGEEWVPDWLYDEPAPGNHAAGDTIEGGAG